MKHTPFIAALVSSMLLSLAGCATAADTNSVATWQSLFNGNDLTGWTQQSEGNFTVTNGVLHVSGGNGWLRTDKSYGDFVLEVEWRGMETNFNSGIYVRAPLEGTPWPTNVWQVNLKQSAVGEFLAGSKKVVLSKVPPMPVGEWVKYRIEARGSKLALTINGEHAWDSNELEPSSGYIGIQAEGKTVEIRNIRLQK